MSTKSRTFAIGMLIVSGLLFTSAAHGGNHTWRFSELFSNADGTIQFIELNESMGGALEVNMRGQWIMSDATGKKFDFPANLTEDTTRKYLLLATERFAALPNAPTPDYIIPENFIAVDGDTVRYVFVDVTYGPGELPLDGVMSLGKHMIRVVNNPTNFAGETGTVVVSNIPAASAWGLIVTALALLIAGSITMQRHSLNTAQPAVANASCRPAECAPG